MNEVLPYLGWVAAAVAGLLLFLFRRKPLVPPSSYEKKDKVEQATKAEEKRLEEKAVEEIHVEFEEHREGVREQVDVLKKDATKLQDDSEALNKFLLDTGKEINGRSE